MAAAAMGLQKALELALMVTIIAATVGSAAARVVSLHTYAGLSATGSSARSSYKVSVAKPMWISKTTIL